MSAFLVARGYALSYSLVHVQLPENLGSVEKVLVIHDPKQSQPYNLHASGMKMPTS